MRYFLMGWKKAYQILKHSNQYILGKDVWGFLCGLLSQGFEYCDKNHSPKAIHFTWAKSAARRSFPPSPIGRNKLAWRTNRFRHRPANVWILENPEKLLYIYMDMNVISCFKDSLDTVSLKLIRNLWANNLSIPGEIRNRGEGTWNKNHIYNTTGCCTVLSLRKCDKPLLEVPS